MNLIFFTHPVFLNSPSMTRFASALSSGMQQRGHKTQIWQPKPRLYNLPVPAFFKKWFGYIDQYIIFKFEVKRKIRSCADDTIFVFTDQALGPWIPWIGQRKHAIHCHDFLAQRSALGQIPENPTKRFGQKYQAYIRQGYRQGKHFISVSKKTQTDLYEFLTAKPLTSEMVYNGLDSSFFSGDEASSRAAMGKKTGLDLQQGYILHIGGNQWYKNRAGVIEIYNAFRLLAANSGLPLLLIGHQPSPDILAAYEASAYKKDIHFLSDVGNELLQPAYSGASAFLFPSLAEGFGWPIAEAMACGCPVITTGEAPMTEVAGNAAFLIERRPIELKDIGGWAKDAGATLKKIIDLPATELEKVKQAGIDNARRFEQEAAFDAIEKIYFAISKQ